MLVMGVLMQGMVCAVSMTIFASAAIAEDITVAFWNVENLFDSTVDRRNTREDLFVPSALREKLRKDGEIIRDLNADIVGLMEVENRAILRQLIDEELADLGYGYHALLEERDERGIDVALISRFPFLCYSFDVPDFSRGILVARFVKGDQPFYVIVNHWKSRFGGGEELRMRCSQRVVELVKEIIPQLEGRREVPVLIGGDFNDDDTDAAVRNLEQQGLINTLKPLPREDRWTLPYHNRDSGSVEYNGFDHVFINTQLRDGMHGVGWVRSDVVRPPRMVTSRRINGREYVWPDDDHNAHIGYSDHFPVTATLTVP